jgi:hypothetical protein
VTPDLPHEIAIHLTGGPVESIEPLRGGGNNRLFRVVRGGTPVALKLYAGDADQRRERFEREFGGLTFLWRRGERRIAEPLAADPDARAALYGWLAGTAAPTAGADEVAAMAAFARSLHVAAGDPAARSLPDAREAVLSSRALQAQLLARIARLRAVESEHPELSALLTDRLRHPQRASDGGRLGVHRLRVLRLGRSGEARRRRRVAPGHEPHACLATKVFHVRGRYV